MSCVKSLNVFRPKEYVLIVGVDSVSVNFGWLWSEKKVRDVGV